MTPRKRPAVPIAILGCALLAAGAASAQVSQANMRVSQPTGFAVSRPQSEIAPASPVSTLAALQSVIPVRRTGGAGTLAPVVPDPVLQTAVGALQNEDDNRKARFPGVGANGSAPGDPNMAVGPNHIVQIVNTEYAVYNKSGNIFAGYPKTLGSIFSALGGTCTGEWGDPIAQYDKAADRWLLSQLGSFSAPYLECIAVSQTNDPTGAYNLYSYSFGNNLNDYPKITVWPTSTNSAYLATYNLFANAANYVGVDVCAFDRAAMLSGAASPVQICFTIADPSGSFLPSDLDGSTLPPAGAPGYFLNIETATTLRLYSLAPNFANPASSTLSAPTDITVASYGQACGGGTCIPQPGTSQQLDSLGDRLMYRLAYRNFGDHDTLVVNHSVTAGSTVGVRWYELRSPLTGAFTLYQQGTFAPDATFRWMSSAAMDSAGDIAIGFSASSSSAFPGLRYTGRIATDPLGTMRTESIMFNGIGSQTGGLSRWGDYSALRIDPSDDCTFWYTNEYLPSNGSFNWATFVGSFKFSNCGSTTPDFSLSVSPSSQTVTQGNGTSYTATVSPLNSFTGSVTLSVSGLPSGATATFATNPITGGSGTSAMNVTASTSTPTGIYTLTITGTSGSLTHTATSSLVVNAVPQPDFSLSVSPSSQSVTQGSGTSYTVTSTPLNGFSANVSLSLSGLPSGAGATFGTNPITGSSGSSTISVTTSTSTPTGTYTLTITGTSGTLTHTATAILVVNASGPPGFSISATPSSQTVTRPNSTTYTVTVTALNGFTGNVTFSARGLPSGATAVFSPTSVAGHGTSTLTISTTSSTSTGTFNVRIRGSSGGTSHSVTVRLTVQ